MGSLLLDPIGNKSQSVATSALLHSPLQCRRLRRSRDQSPIEVFRATGAISLLRTNADPAEVGLGLHCSLTRACQSSGAIGRPPRSRDAWRGSLCVPVAAPAFSVTFPWQFFSKSPSFLFPCYGTDEYVRRLPSHHTHQHPLRSFHYFKLRLVSSPRGALLN